MFSLVSKRKKKKGRDFNSFSWRGRERESEMNKQMNSVGCEVKNKKWDAE